MTREADWIQKQNKLIRLIAVSCRFHFLTSDDVDYFHQYVHIHIYTTYHCGETMIRCQQVFVIELLMTFRRFLKDKVKHVSNFREIVSFVSTIFVAIKWKYWIRILMSIKLIHLVLFTDVSRNDRYSWKFSSWSYSIILLCSWRGLLFVLSSLNNIIFYFVSNFNRFCLHCGWNHVK